MWKSHYADSPLMAYPLFALVLFVSLFAAMVIWVMASSAKKRWREEATLPFDDDEVSISASFQEVAQEGSAA